MEIGKQFVIMKSAKTVQHLTSVFNIPEIEDEDEVDYKKLYEKEKRTRIFYEKKARQMEAKLRNYIKENRHVLGQNKQQDIHNIIDEIKSFKNMLPNSVKEISIDSSDNCIDQDNIYALIKEFAVYGLKQTEIKAAEPSARFEGTTIFSNQKVSQILEHTARLVFPSGTGVEYYSAKEAQEKSLSIINISKESLKSFILTFEPTSFEKKLYTLQEQSNCKQEELVVNILNSERRIYAISIILDDFTVLQNQNQPFEKVENKLDRKKSQKTVRFKEKDTSKVQQLKIAVTKRVYTIFSYYPFFSFFQELLRNLLYSAKVERYIKYKESGQNLQLIDSIMHGQMMKYKLENLRNEGKQKKIVLDKLIDFTLGPNNKIYLQLTKPMCERFLADDWAFTVLSLFTLDVFIDVLTLMILEQKMVFVCQNKTILTYAIFLFTKVLIRPFEYPYPVVNLIPDQEQYLNAPFPIVYGYNKSKEELLMAKIPKRYRNVYVFFEPTGVEIMSEDNKQKLLNHKSPRLRDKLISKFKKMQRNYPSISLFSFISKKGNSLFEYNNNKELALQIVNEIYYYMLNDIYNILPSAQDVQEIRNQIVARGDVDDDEVNQVIFLKIKEIYWSKSKDPFFSAFLQTQLLNVHIFKY